MTEGSASPKIYSAIAAVMNDVGHVSKDKVNKQQGFKFRSIDDVYNALHPALAKNKVFIVPEILEQTRELKRTKSGTEMISVICKIKFTFFAEDGSSVESILIGEGLDTGDKATNKAMAIAYKYACFQVFCIPTEEMIDPDAERPELAGESEKTEAKKPTNSNKQKQSEEPVGEDAKATQAMINTIRAEQKRTGVTDDQILGRRKITSKRIEDFTVGEFRYIMSIFEKTKIPDVQVGEA